MNKHRILITGVTGFIGSHIAARALRQGHAVRGSMRNLDRADSIRVVIGKVAPVERLSFVQADLTEAASWTAAVEGMDYVLHVASPFPTTVPKTDEELVRPAVNGTLNVLRAAAAAGVKRTVVTSSTGASVHGVRRVGTFTEADWTDVNNRKDSTPYFRSKTLAERAAWDFIDQDESGMELTTVLPGAVLGPLLEADPGTSSAIVLKLLNGSVPAVPPIGFSMVDVRSIAELHLLAMAKPAAAGQRYLGADEHLRFKEVADVLRRHLPDRKIPNRVLPKFAVRLLSIFDPEIGPALVGLGARREVDSSKAKKELAWSPLPMEQSIRDCADSLLKYNIIA